MSEEKIPPLNELGEKPENNLTISTKLSTEQLICKTPQESPNVSVKSLKNELIVKNSEKEKINGAYTSLLYLGTLQIFMGLLMVVFGVLVVVYNARLAQFGGGLWGGCLAIVSGVTGALAAARNWCPLKSSAQKIAHTAFLALSLISVAVSQLVLVVAATGLARDINHSDFHEDNPEITTTPKSDEYFENLPSNYLAIVSNAGLLIVSGIQCICAAIASYYSSRKLCPCFRDQENASDKQIDITKDAFVNSWLGNHTLPTPLYIMAGPNSRKLSKHSSNLPVGPLMTVPRSVLTPPPLLSYPLIPAPLGTIPSPMIRPHSKQIPHHKHRRYHQSRNRQVQRPNVPRKQKKIKTKPKEKPSITTEQVVRTYTGLDRTIAEEFIEICESQKTSLCSDLSCSSCKSIGCNGSHSGCTTSDTSTDVKL